MNSAPAALELWPALPLEQWQGTYDTLHLYSQIIGKVRMALSHPINQWWHVTLYVSARGLTTSLMPYARGFLDIEFDFIDHQLVFRTSQGTIRKLPLVPRSVADFYAAVMAELRGLGVNVAIHARPDEVPNPIPFAEDRQHASYDAEAANRFWRVLLQVDDVFKRFRSGFTGKCSPVHFFWGSFDLAVTRFSGRLAPDRPGADAVTREAYRCQVSSAGFWPGGGQVPGPAFYSYAAPAPEGFSSAKVAPAQAFFHPQLSEFILMYEEIRRAADPADLILQFCQSTYDAAANLGRWDRASLEQAVGTPARAASAV